MSNNFNKVIESLSSFSGADLDDLKDAINDELKAREHKQVIDLQEKAIAAIKNYLNAGGSLCSSQENFLVINEQPDYDDDFYHIHLM